MKYKWRRFRAAENKIDALEYVLAKREKQNKRYRELLDRILELQLYINYSEAELYEEVLKIMDEYLGLESESK